MLQKKENRIELSESVSFSTYLFRSRIEFSRIICFRFRFAFDAKTQMQFISKNVR